MLKCYIQLKWLVCSEKIGLNKNCAERVKAGIVMANLLRPRTSSSKIMKEDFKLMISISIHLVTVVTNALPKMWSSSWDFWLTYIKAKPEI